MKVVRICLGLLLNAAVGMLCLLIPSKKGLLLLGSNLGKGLRGNPKYFYLYLISLRDSGKLDPEIQFFWVAESNELLSDLKRRGWPVLAKFSFRGFWSIVRAEHIIVESINAVGELGHDVGYERLFIGRRNLVQTFHGIPIKRICLDALSDRGSGSLVERLFVALTMVEYDRYRSIVAESEYDRGVFSQAFGNQRVYVLGSARSDIMYDKSLATRCYQSELGLARYKKVVLYAPTFRDRRGELRPFSSQFLVQLNDTLKDRDYVLLVKKHAFDKNLELPADLTHIRDVSAVVEDIQELLIHVDMVITDYSSVAFDFSLAKRPIIFYPYDLDEYLKFSRRMYVDFLSEIPGPVAASEEELLDLLLNADCWFNEPEYADRFQQFVEKFHAYADGNSSRRLFRHLTGRCEIAAESAVDLQVVSDGVGPQ